MDWGLLERNLSENTLLREEVVYPYKVINSKFSKLFAPC